MSQPLEALEAANGIRLRRAAFRRLVKPAPTEHGRWIVGQVFRNPQWWWATARVSYVLGCAPHVGPSAIRRWSSAAGLTADRRLEELTERQREMLAGLLEGNNKLPEGKNTGKPAGHPKNTQRRKHGNSHSRS